MSDPDLLVRQLRRGYPDSLARLGRVQLGRGRNGLPDWPSWCWLPMAATVDYVMSTSRLPEDIAAALTEPGYTLTPDDGAPPATITPARPRGTGWHPAPATRTWTQTPWGIHGTR